MANALADDGPDGMVARDRLAREDSLHAPHLVDVEVLSVLRRRAAAGDVSDRRAAVALADLEDLPLTRYPHLPLLRRAWDLRRNATAYDALYLTLAEELGCDVVTADRRLARVPGIRCAVEVLETAGGKDRG